MAGLARDPVSVFFDEGARRLLARAYARPGQWVSTRLEEPSVASVLYLGALGINPYAPDRGGSAAGARGGLDARTRWARGFVRALYYQHRWWSKAGDAGGWFRRHRRTVPRGDLALQVEVGPMLRQLGVLPAGRQVRIRVRPGGKTAARAVAAMPAADRIFAPDGGLDSRWSDPEYRDWAAS